MNNMIGKKMKSLFSGVLAMVIAFTAIPLNAQAEEVNQSLKNLALGKNVIGSSYKEGTNFTPDKVVDGDTSLGSRWGTGQDRATGEYVEIDLNGEKSINQIVIHFERSDEEQNILGYHVELDATTVHTKSEKSAQVETITFNEAKTASKVKVVIDNADGGSLNWVNVGITEIQVFGEDLSEAPGQELTEPEEQIVSTKNVNHVRTATMSASSVEENASSLAADKANDGNESTRWSSRSITNDTNGQEWLKADFGQLTLIKHIKVKFHTRGDVDPSPNNASQFTIKYINKDGIEQTAKANYMLATSGEGYVTEASIVLDNEIVAKAIKLCDFEVKVGSTQWNSVGINELEAYSNEIKAGAIINLEALVASLEGMQNAVIEDGTFVLPEVPEGYSIKLNGADFEQILGKDMTVVQPLTDKEIQVSFEVSKGSETAITNDITYLVKGKNTQAEGMNSKPVIIPEIQEWYSESTEKLAVDSITKVTYSDDSLEAVVDEFIADYKDFTGVTLTKEKGTAQAGAYNFSKTAPDVLLGEEGYTMNILADRINVEAESITGNMYGMQTILQMYKKDADGFSIGQMRDYPRFEVRGFMLDIARKPIGMDMVNEIARTMRYYKMNDFQLHLSDNYIFLEQYGHGANENESFKAYEAFRLESGVTNEAGESPTAKDYYITKAEMKEFIQSQRALGMNIVPEIDLPAHATSFTKIWPELMVQGKVSPSNGSRPLVDHIDVSKPEAVAKIKELFDDYTIGEDPTFDSETTVHVGADEFVTDYTAYREFVNEIVPHVKATNSVRMWGGLTWINDGKTEIVTDAIENVEMNLWSRDWADGIDMYNMGYKLINTIDSYNYMVPNGNMGRGAYGDLLNIDSAFSNFEPNKVSSRNGWIEIPSGDDQALGAVYAIWNDNIDKSSSGLTESDLYWRFFDAMPIYAEKNWAATGREKGSASALTELALELGTGPRTNPYYQETKDNNGVIESYDFANGLEDASANDRDLTAGTASVEDGALNLKGGNSYVSTPIDKVGNGNELSFDITLTKIPVAGDILFETTPEYGTHDIRIMENGRLGFTRELHDYYFDYELPVGKKVNIKIVAKQQDTMLYVDGVLVGEAVGKFVHNGMEKKTGIAHSTFAIPVERIGSETNAITAEIDNVVVKETKEVVLYDKAEWSGTTNSETQKDANEGLLKYAFDGKAGTIWHSNWQGATDKLNGSNSFYAEIDFGQAYEINRFSFTPRNSANSGYVTKADLYVKENASDDWKMVGQDVTFASDNTKKTFYFEEQNVRYVKFVAKQSNDGWVAVSEFDVANIPELKMNVYVEATEGGTVTGAQEVSKGTSVTVQATANEGYSFEGWYDIAGTKVFENAEYTFTVEKNTALVAKFVEAPEISGDYVTEENLTAKNTEAPAKDTVIPDANQYEYHKQELAAFCHFGPNTFNEIEWGENYGNRTPSEIFTLTENFDAETMVKTLKDAGFKKLIVTAKHHDGFCIWNSAYTTYDVESTTYAEKNYDEKGGDILWEISEACTKYDMDMGLYLSPWDIHEPSYGYKDANGNGTSKENDVLDYNDFYNNQLEEILSNPKYGNNGHFNEIWMDGAKGSGANAQEYDFQRWFNTIQKYEGKQAGYEADCMLFGAYAYTGVRWIGNESGYAAEETWAQCMAYFDKTGEESFDANQVGEYRKGFPDGNIWTVPEADARITSGWFWGTTKATPKTVEALAEMYFRSVGHNATLLLNVPPNNQGTVDQAILDRVTEFGNNIEETFRTNMASNATVMANEVRGNDLAYKPGNVVDGDDATYWTVNDGSKTGTLVIDLGATKTFDVVAIEESIEFGQRINSFIVEYRNGDDEWKVFDEGTTIGSKRLSRKAPVNADELRITVSTESKVPMIAEVAVYKASEGFELVSAVPAGMEVIDETDSAFKFTGSWEPETGDQYVNGTNSWCNAGASFEVSFTGTKIYLVGTKDPKHGTADIYIDGTKVTSINTSASPRQTGQLIYESETLSEGTHTLKLAATGIIGIEGAYVINNGGLGMIGIEEAEYTMNEDSELEVKLVRVGGSKGEAVVEFTPNPGSAIQDDYDTEANYVITFAEGETEKTAIVRTRRNTNKTGTQYFTVELASSTENLILGFNSMARINIIDTEDEHTDTDIYTAGNRFRFPGIGETTVLEMERTERHNNTEGDGEWPLQITEASWASNGKFLNCLNANDRAVLYYNAPKAGTYKAVVSYRSGDPNNSLVWSEAEGKITAGEVSAGAGDSAGATHTATFTFEVAQSGEGILTFKGGASKAPQLDKIEITEIQLEEEPVDEEYTIIYDLNEGTNNPENPVTYTSNSDTIKLKAPTRKGYDFAGWYNSEGKKVTKIKSGSTGNVKLTAKWKVVTYKISYKLGGGKNNSKNPKNYKVTTSTIKLKAPTQKGYTFEGWYTDKEFTKKVTSIKKGSAGKVTLYAKWSLNTYKITYKLKGGKNSSKNPKKYTVETSKITLRKPTKKGYKFVGWYNSKGKKVTSIKKGSTGKVTLTAKWKKK